MEFAVKRIPMHQLSVVLAATLQRHKAVETASSRFLPVFVDLSILPKDSPKMLWLLSLLICRTMLVAHRKIDPLSSAAPLQGVKDILRPPGVLVEPRWGDDARFWFVDLACFVTMAGDEAMYLESNPINTSDGYVDLFESDASCLPLCRNVHGSKCAALWC